MGLLVEFDCYCYHNVALNRAFYITKQHSLPNKFGIPSLPLQKHRTQNNELSNLQHSNIPLSHFQTPASKSLLSVVLSSPTLPLNSASNSLNLKLSICNPLQPTIPLFHYSINLIQSLTNLPITP